MNLIKSPSQIEVMRQGGVILAGIMDQLLACVRVGTALNDIDNTADALIAKSGGEPSFKKVRDYRWATCININDGVVHGIPTKYKIKENDIVSIDIGILYKGFNTDMSWSVLAGNDKNRQRFLSAGEETLRSAIQSSVAGNHVGDISRAIELNLKKAGYFPVKQLTGHGVGKKLHEEPMIPGFQKRDIKATPPLQAGMTLALEVIYSESNTDIYIEDDGWTIKTANGCLAGLFEQTIVVRSGPPLVLT